MESNSVMKANNIFSFDFFGSTINISNSIIMMWIIMAFLIISAFFLTRKLKTIPEGKQNFIEAVVELINNIIKGNIGHHWRPFAPYFGTVLIFLVFANTVSLFNIFPSAELLYKLTGFKFFEHMRKFVIEPPTKDINVTVTMALMTIIIVLFAGIRYKGITGWIKSFAKPSPIMIPFHIMDYGTRTLSLSLRLFGNILAGFIIMELLYSSLPYLAPIIPVASSFFDIFDGLLQAYIFVFLSSIYVSEAIE